MTDQRVIGTPEWTRAALAAVAAHRANPGPVACPTCAQPGLTVIDRSVPPHAQWYVLNCSACGLVHTLHIPMAQPMSWD